MAQSDFKPDFKTEGKNPMADSETIELIKANRLKAQREEVERTRAKGAGFEKQLEAEEALLRQMEQEYGMAVEGGVPEKPETIQ